MRYKEWEDRALMSLGTFDELGKVSPLKTCAFSELLHGFPEET